MADFRTRPALAQRGNPRNLPFRFRPTMPKARKMTKTRTRWESRGALERFRGKPKEPPPPEPVRIPLVWFRRLVGVILLPVCWIVTAALFGVFEEAKGRSLWHSREVWLFSVGFLLWLIAFIFLPRPTGLYVVGHEYTHAIFVRLCGGRVGRVHASADGGYVLSDRNNFLIGLSPYIFPFWTFVSLAILGVAGLVLKIPYHHHVLFFCTGVSWSFHITFTIDMITKNQPDIEDNGRFFSLTLIYLCNVLIISALLVIASPRVTLVGFGKRAAAEAMEMFNGAVPK
jgi:hypothetical protein